MILLLFRTLSQNKDSKSFWTCLWLLQQLTCIWFSLELLFLSWYHSDCEMVEIVHLSLFREGLTFSPYKQVPQFMTNTKRAPPHPRNLWVRAVSKHRTVWFLSANWISDEAVSTMKTLFLLNSHLNLGHSTWSAKTSETAEQLLSEKIGSKTTRKKTGYVENANHSKLPTNSNHKWYLETKPFPQVFRFDMLVAKPAFQTLWHIECSD